MITHVAILHHGTLHSMSKPGRHHHIIHRIYLETGESVDDEIQGFLDDQGNFLTRGEAYLHARDCGQLKNGQTIHHDDWLSSEDVW